MSENGRLPREPTGVGMLLQLLAGAEGLDEVYDALCREHHRVDSAGALVNAAIWDPLDPEAADRRTPGELALQAILQKVGEDALLQLDCTLIDEDDQLEDLLTLVGEARKLRDQPQVEQPQVEQPAVLPWWNGHPNGQRRSRFQTESELLAVLEREGPLSRRQLRDRLAGSGIGEYALAQAMPALRFAPYMGSERRRPPARDPWLELLPGSPPRYRVRAEQTDWLPEVRRTLAIREEWSADDLARELRLTVRRVELALGELEREEEDLVEVLRRQLFGVLPTKVRLAVDGVASAPALLALDGTLASVLGQLGEWRSAGVAAAWLGRGDGHSLTPALLELERLGLVERRYLGEGRGATLEWRATGRDPQPPPPRPLDEPVLVGPSGVAHLLAEPTGFGGPQAICGSCSGEPVPDDGNRRLCVRCLRCRSSASHRPVSA